MKKLIVVCFVLLASLSVFYVNMVFAGSPSTGYDRNKAMAVEKVLFGQVISVRNITQDELIQDSSQGWKVFGGALIGGAIGHQFGGGHGQTAATILGAVIGSSMANDRHEEYKKVSIYLVELMIKTENGKQYMIVQDYDPQMVFTQNDAVRMVYLENGVVRIDIQQ